MNYELACLSAADIGRLVNERLISPTEVLDYFKNRIDKCNADLNAFVYFKWDEAYKKAKQLEKRLKEGEELGKFAGVPFALKDFLPSKKGWTHSFGGVKSLITEDEYDSEFCKAMEELDAIAIGKTNAPSFGFSGLCSNKLYGATKNPYNLGYSSGGSSGGSACAVGSGMIPIAEGGDAGGSIRIPAAWCNVVGFKASAGMIPNICRPDAWAATHPYCINGGITKDVNDAIILFNQMRKFNNRDPLSVRAFTPVTHNLRIAYTFDFGIYDVDKEIIAVIKSFMKSRNIKADFIEPKIKRTVKEISECWCRAISIDTSIEFEEWKKRGIIVPEEELPKSFIEWNNKAFNSTVMDYYEFNKIRTELYDMQQDIFDDYDILICPVTSRNPYKLDEDSDNVVDLIGFAETMLFNFTGNPAISIPCGFSKNGLPIGIQIVGRIHHDSELLEYAKGLNNEF